MMESVNVMVEDVEQCKNDPRKFIYIEDEDTVKTLEPYCDGRTNDRNSTSTCDSNETRANKVIKPKNSDSRVLKDILLIPSLITEGKRTRGKKNVDYREMAGMISMTCYSSTIEPKNIEKALTDEYWTEAMQDELQQFERNDVWELVPRLDSVNVNGSKWVYKNKADRHGNITQNKARLVTQGYTQIERLDFDETFAPVTCLESVGLLVSISFAKQLTLQ